MLRAQFLALTLLAAGALFGQNLFQDSFSAPGTKLDLTKWTAETGPGSFLGRTQLADWVTPGGVGQFVIGADGAHLAVNTFNPTGSSLYGTQAETRESFQPGVHTTMTLKASLRLTSLQPGLVYGVYFYGCSAPPTCASRHDEIDIELVTNYLQKGGAPVVELNRYANEPLGAGNAKLIRLPAGFNPLASHDWTIRWSRAQIEYLVDGLTLFSATTHVPQGPMKANVIAWAPASNWPAAFNTSLQPAASAAQDQAFVALLTSISVTESSPPG